MKTQFSLVRVDIIRPLLVATFGLALALTFGCSSGDKSDDGGGVSTQANVVYGADVTYEGETYKTIVIGNQTWFQRNLNYSVSGSKCGNGSNLSDANTATCDTYGRLYNWATAMKLPTICNSSTCADQVLPKHQGICPIGWHIPSDAEWDALMTAVGGSLAGRYLKAREGWNNCGPSGSGKDYLCEDTKGFSALPGGGGNSDDFFGVTGHYGSWWSASEGNSDIANSGSMDYGSENVFLNHNDKTNYHSVRCLKD